MSSFKDENGNDAYRYHIAMNTEILNPLTRMVAEKSDGRRACERAFEFAIRFSSGCNLVVEFLAAVVWPLGTGFIVYTMHKL
jgi:hypothetical protein